MQIKVPFGQDPSQVYDEEHGYDAKEAMKRCCGTGLSEDAKTGGDSMPVVNTPTPFKKMKGAGGG